VGRGVSFCHPLSLPATKPSPSLERGQRGLFRHPHSPVPATNLRRLKRRRRGLFSSPTLSACHQPPPSLEMRAEVSSFVTHTLCLPLTPSVARNTGGGVFFPHPHTLPATNLLCCLKCERRCLSLSPTLSAATNPLHRLKRGQRSFFCHPHSLLLTPSVARNTGEGVFFCHPHSLPATNPLRHSKRQWRGLFLSPTLCLPPTPSIARSASGGVFFLCLLLRITFSPSVVLSSVSIPSILSIILPLSYLLSLISQWQLAVLVILELAINFFKPII